jgi:Mrp family chromosome partitioning ATPase/DUF971 family protein
MVREEDILEALRNIIDPDFNKDIVSLGFVQNVRIKEDEVSLDIHLTTPACPVKNEFQRAAEEAVRRIKGVRQVKVNMTSTQKPSAAFKDIPGTLNDVKSIVAVSSCKGGVGKSTVAAYLAQDLAGRGFKVGLVDADIYGPSVPALFGLQNAAVYVNEEKQLIPVEKNGLKIMSFGFLLGDGPAVMRGPMVSQYIQQMLHTTLWGDLDYLFIDMPPGTGDVHLTITQSVRLSGAVIVTTPQTLSLIDVARGILMFEKVSVPILGVIENMAYFICDGCGKRHMIFGADGPSSAPLQPNGEARPKGGRKSLEERFGIETLAELPLSARFTHRVTPEAVRDGLIRQAVDRTVMALGKSSILQKQVPQIRFDDGKVTLAWADGNTLDVDNRRLRLNCRCALCVDETTGKQILKPEDVRPDISPREIMPLGNYAVGITWNDGHASGIYPYQSLREMARAAIL